MSPKSKQPLSTSAKTPILVVFFLILAFLLGGLLWVTIFRPSAKNSASKTNTFVPATNTVANTVPAIVNPPIEQMPDDDRDGLSNDEEQALNTDPKKSDSDDDGLSDRVEVKVYQTDPLKADTDTDGKRDGEEVKAGSNPKGEGTLLDLPKAIEQLNNTQTP